MSNQDLLSAYHYPIEIKFRLSTLHNDFEAKDASGRTHAYAKQKLFKLKEHVRIFEDMSQTNLKYEIRADKWLDFNTCYNFMRTDGSTLGKLLRKGWRSIWKANYEIYDENNQPDLYISEANPWAKVLDSMLGEIPILSMFSGYLFNPKYNISRPDGTLVMQLTKKPSFLGRTFILNKHSSFESGEEERILLGTMMMILLERRRG